MQSPPDRFREYHEGIRREYALVPDLIYNLKRKQALKRFLARERIFLTEEFRERYETQARENLAWAIGS